MPLWRNYKKVGTFHLSDSVLADLAAYISEHYVQAYTDVTFRYSRSDNDIKFSAADDPVEERFCLQTTKSACIVGAADDAASAGGLPELLASLDAGFSETLLQLIDRTGEKDSQIYKKANVDRKLFSKIRNNPDYKPSKTTAIAFAIALELNLEETKDFISRAGYALSRSSKFDVIIEYFIRQGEYDIYKINEALFAFDQSLLGA